MSYTRSSARALRRTVLSYYRKHGRHDLPWRKTHDPYRIMVSEIMLQQTQVDRVIPKYRAFIRKFPTVRALARAPLSAVLREWHGLGYNRRAKMLHQAAQAIVKKHNGRFPLDRNDLIDLPGIGPYTASAIRVFAHNQPDSLIETNVRAVFLHHFFPKKQKIADFVLLPYIEALTDTKAPREWYSALMDYGSYLKKTVPNPSRRSAHHTRQKPFKGSDREIRGAILKALVLKDASMSQLLSLPFENERIKKQLRMLVHESLVAISGRRVSLAD